MSMVKRRVPRLIQEFHGVDRAKQSFKDGADINLIMGKYLRGGSVDHLAKHGATYGMFEPQTFHEAMEVVRIGQEMFADLPAAQRQRFANSPESFLRFIQDSSNIDEMRKLGLALPVKAQAKPEPLEVRVVDAAGKEVPKAP